MARIERKHQKIFAAEAANNGVFGSAADSTKILSSDLDTIQSKAAFSEGWLEAVLSDKKFPALEEFQALHYMTTSQIAYIFQEGIPAYSASATYFTNSIVKKAGTYEVYGSKINNNIGNALPDAEDDANWKFLQDLTAQVQDATESQKGIAEIATTEEVKAGVDDERYVTPAKLDPYKPATGDGKDHWTSNLQDGWIWADGKTIGNASSNATNRANDDCEDLFKAFWNDYSNSLLPLFDSDGDPVSRGSSAAADWAANCAISVIDKRDRVSAGKGNMGGTPAGRLSGQTNGVSGNSLGNSGGQETHSNTADENGPHTHGGPLNLRSINSLAANASPADIVGTNTSIVRPLIPPFPATQSSGLGAPHNNVQPTIVCNYIIKL